MPWTIEYTEAALTQLRRLDKWTARRIVDYMDERVAPLNDSRRIGRSLVGSLEQFRFRTNANRCKPL